MPIAMPQGFSCALYSTFLLYLIQQQRNANPTLFIGMGWFRPTVDTLSFARRNAKL